MLVETLKSIGRCSVCSCAVTDESLETCDCPPSARLFVDSVDLLLLTIFPSLRLSFPSFHIPSWVSCLNSGTIKDAVTRYAHQTGHYVSRRAGWDCHGLPVEYEIDQSLGIKHRDQVKHFFLCVFISDFLRADTSFRLPRFLVVYLTWITSTPCH